MTSNRKDPVLVVLQLSGAFDALNTIIPYNDPLYMDYRPVLKVEPEDVLAIDGKIGFSLYILFDIQPHYLSGVQRSTFHGEIDIVDFCAARTVNYGAGLAGTNGVPTLTTSAPPLVHSTTNDHSI